MTQEATFGLQPQQFGELGAGSRPIGPDPVMGFTAVDYIPPGRGAPAVAPERSSSPLSSGDYPVEPKVPGHISATGDVPPRDATWQPDY